MIRSRSAADSIGAAAVMRSGRISSTIDEPRGVVHRGAAGAQDRHAPLVVPVVQDALEDVDVAAGRDRREEVALDELAAIGHALLGEVGLRERERARPFEQEPASSGRCRRTSATSVPAPPPTSTRVSAPRRRSDAASSRATGSVRASMRAAALASVSGCVA